MRISQLPTRIKELALKYADPRADSDFISTSFIWEQTPEGYSFWNEIDQSNFKPFYDLYGYDESEHGKWISVDDRLPENGQLVFTFSEIGIVICSHSDGIFRFYESESENKTDITHWAKLEIPKPPKS